MSFTDDEFDRLEKEVATLFLPPFPREAGPAESERIERIMNRVDVREPGDAVENPAVESSDDAT